MGYLFLVNIGPVQSFIASARRTRDLWFGSGLLSELAKAAAREIARQNKLDNLIFPAPASIDELEPDDLSLNVPNKILALIDQEPEEIGKEVYKAIKTRLNEIRNRAYGKIDVKFFRDVADQQVDDLVEYFWVALPFDKEQGNYEQTRNQLEALMAARKNTRDFRAVAWGSAMPKSSIDGQLESVIPQHHYPHRDDSDQEKSRKIQQLYRYYRAGQAERLSGVDLLKRRGEFKDKHHTSKLKDEDAVSAFPSTSHIAAVPYLQCLETLRGPNLISVERKWNAYIERVKVLAVPEVISGYKAHSIIERYDGSFFFIEQLLEMGVEKERLEGPKKALEAFFQSVDDCFEKKKLRPAPYYAILQADGDRMGKVIDKQAKDGYSKHQELSHALNSLPGKLRRL